MPEPLSPTIRSAARTPSNRERCRRGSAKWRLPPRIGGQSSSYGRSQSAGRRHFGVVRALRVVVLARPSLSRFEFWMPRLHARALRADFCDELLHQIRIRFDVIAAAIGSLFLAFILPCAEFFFGPIFQIADGDLCQIQCHSSCPHANPKYRPKKAISLSSTACFLAAWPLFLVNRDTGGRIFVMAVPVVGMPP